MDLTYDQVQRGIRDLKKARLALRNPVAEKPAETDTASSTPGFLTEAPRMFRLTVRCHRIITVSPVRKARVLPAKWVLGDLQAASAIHARSLYWSTCAHRCPKTLGSDGQPVQTRRLKLQEIEVVELAPDAPGKEPGDVI